MVELMLYVTPILLFSFNMHDEVALHSTTIIIVISFNVTE